MKMTPLSRREFSSLAAGTIVAPLMLTRSAAVTAEDVIERIKKSIGVDWKPETVDTFKAGDPTSTVNAIAVTAFPTLAVLGRAVKGGANLIITCEPTFYSRRDSPTPPAGRGAGGAASTGASPTPAAPARPDPVFAAKQTFIAKHHLVVWRFSDHWRLRAPDPFAQGLGDALGWSKFRAPADPSRVSIPALRLDVLASEVKAKLGARGGVRVVGAPQTTAQKIALLPGTTAIQAALKTLPEVDVVIAGEVREWETVEYARDHAMAGGKKGLITIGRVLSEEPGMNVCARWLGTIVPEVKSTWIAAGDPYWRPV